MKLRLLYKSYSRTGLTLAKGDVHEFPDAEAEQMVKDFPGWFEKVEPRGRGFLKDLSKEKPPEPAPPGPEGGQADLGV